MFTLDRTGLELDDAVEIALYSSALFDQYDEFELVEAANDDDYENLYPNIG